MFKGLTRWLFGATEYPVLVVGNDASGKTTLLYRLKLNKLVTAIPTIGFNVETIEYPRGWQWTMWDVGGCDKIQPLLRHYLKPNTLVLFLHDCSDTDRQEFPEWLRYFLNDMVEAQSKYIWILPTKQDAITERETFISGVRQMYEKELAQYKRDIQYKVLEHKLSAKTGEGMQEVMAELYRTMALESGRVILPKIENDIGPQKAPTSEEELKALIDMEGNDDNIKPESFWLSFLSADLPAWDHRSHLKAGYFIVLDDAAKGDSIFTTADKFITHIKRLKETHPDRFRNTEHQTMTIFWLLQLQLAIWNYKIDKGLDQFPAWGDFQDVLLHAPSLRNTKLWSLYYTRDRIFSQQAREAWIIPDLQQFPILKPQPIQTKSTPIAMEGSDRLLRFAYAITQHILASGLRRGAVIKDALSSLQATTIRLRIVDLTIPPYSETQAYFWIQVVHAALRSLESQKERPDFLTKKSYDAFPTAQLSFSNFTILFDITPKAWKGYYSSEIWDSVAARIEFVPPDIKPLPNIIGISSDAHKKATI
ncbi:P-loop containing nucleoside triphosphate hydrolase protein [Aspergillus cavernicola]|uniref:P-loop containing nucleoside triphosphate hydrolase protein n=1 Tax=Aspergillus cavernicola TaxID=176166 RepID=A0ABR4HPH0_9EURO